VTQVRLGGAVDVALEEVALRMGSRELGWVATAVAVHGRVGGNLAEILDTVGDAIYAQGRLRGQVRSLTAQGRMTQLVLTLLPFGLGVMLYLLNPSFMDEMLSRPIGIVVLAGAAGLNLVGSWLISRIVNIQI
jgi:tight adherence protein B